MNFSKVKLRSALNYAGWAVFALSLGIILYYIIFPAEGEYHADYADTLMWGLASTDSGAWFPRDFTWAAILPTGGNLLMLPGLAIWGVSMNAHVLGMALFAILFAAAAWFFFRSLSFSPSRSAALAGLFLLFITSTKSQRWNLWGHVLYYNLSSIYLMLILALALRLLSETERRNRLRLTILLAVSSLASAINGFTILSFCAVPIIGALMAVEYFSGDRIKMNDLIGLGVVVAGTALGFIIGKLLIGDVQAGYANHFTYYSEQSTWVRNMDDFIPALASLFGVGVGSATRLFSVESVLAMIRTFIMAALLILPIIAVINYKKIADKRVKILLIVHLVVSAVTVYVMILGHVLGAHRLYPMMATAVLFALAYLAPTIPKGTLSRWGMIILAAIVVVSFVNFGSIAAMPPSYGSDNFLHQYVDALEAHGLTRGYAEYWGCQALSLSVIGGPDLTVLPITVDYGNAAVTPYVYNVNSKWYQDDQTADRYFVLLDPEPYSRMIANPGWTELSKSVVEEFTILDAICVVFNRNPV
jgi:hypothetical protein